MISEGGVQARFACRVYCLVFLVHVLVIFYSYTDLLRTFVTLILHNLYAGVTITMLCKSRLGTVKVSRFAQGILGLV
jgi:hypothetical protein